MPSAFWQPVLYSRTRRVDRWWRVRPQNLPDSWLEDVVLAVVGGGYDLDESPRFLLTRKQGVRLVGVTCRASRLSETMHSDGNRELYCFVGWCTRDAGGRIALPPLADLTRDYRKWAGEVYERWMAKDWDRGAHELRVPHVPAPDAAPWDRSGELPAAPSRHGPSPEHPREIWPSEDAEPLWEWGRATTQEHVIATGWRTLPTVPPLLTHVAVDDVSRRTALSSVPARPRPPQRPVTPAATDPDPHVEPETSPSAHGKDAISRGLDVVVGVAEKLFSGPGPQHDDQSPGHFQRADDAPREPSPQDPSISPVAMDPARERLEAAPDSREQWGDAWGGFGEDSARAVRPDETATEPEQVAAEPEQLAAEPEQAAPQPEQVAAQPEVVEAPSAGRTVLAGGATLAYAGGLRLRSLTVPPRASRSLTTVAAGLCVALEGSADVEDRGRRHPVNEHLVFRFQEPMTMRIGAGERGARLLIVERAADECDHEPTLYG